MSSYDEGKNGKNYVGNSGVRGEGGGQEVKEGVEHN